MADATEPQFNPLSSVLSSRPVIIRNWDEFQTHLQSYRGDHRYKWCFRGQANSNWPLVPGLERLVLNRRRENLRNVERVLLDRFKRQAHHYLPKTPEESAVIEWYALMQHWGVPTRLLDFTLSPYVALFFALRERASGCAKCVPTHASVWAIHHVCLQSLAKRELNIKRRVGGPEFRIALDRLVEQDTDRRFVAPIQPFLMNERLSVQQGMFLCPSTVKLPMDILFSQPEDFHMFVDPQKKKIKDSFARKLIIPIIERPTMLRELSRMNINSSSLCPGMDGYARSIRESYESLDDETPFYKQIALETLEDFGWTG
jgi:hypothetical protein